MRGSQNKSRVLVVTFFFLILCFGIVGNSLFAYSSVVTPSKCLKFSDSHFLNQDYSDKDKIPFLPDSPFGETEDNESNDSDDGFSAYHKQFLFEIVDQIPQTCNTTASGHNTLALYVLFHSWKSFLP